MTIFVFYSNGYTLGWKSNLCMSVLLCTFSKATKRADVRCWQFSRVIRRIVVWVGDSAESQRVIQFEVSKLHRCSAPKELEALENSMSHWEVYKLMLYLCLIPTSYWFFECALFYWFVLRNKCKAYCHLILITRVELVYIC